LSFSGKNRLQTGASGRFVLGMLLFAWLNVAAQPCLMAMEMAPDASLASEHTVHSGHTEHASDADDSLDCGHCPQGAISQEVLCETGSASDCEVFPGYNVDGRHFQAKLKDVSPPFTLCILDSAHDFSNRIPLLLPHDDKRLKFTDAPPLNIRHCVFLK
jgi:hypothetical protein